MIKKWWKKLKYWQKAGLIGGISYTLFAYYWGFVGIDIACDYLYPKPTGYECLVLLLPLFPAGMINNWLDDNFLRIIIPDWRTSFKYDLLGYIIGTAVYFVQGFLIGALLSFIYIKFRKR